LQEAAARTVGALQYPWAGGALRAHTRRRGHWSVLLLHPVAHFKLDPPAARVCKQIAYKPVRGCCGCCMQCSDTH